jgi:beta-lactamase regulating signal transducer with metallopeptidase domain
VGLLLHVGGINALAAALLGLAAIAAGRRSRRPALVHGLWVLVLLKLVTPPLVPLALLPPEPEAAARPVLPAPSERSIALVSDPAPEAPSVPPMRFANLDELKVAAQAGALPLLPAVPAPEVGVPASAGLPIEDRLKPVLLPTPDAPPPFAPALPAPPTDSQARSPSDGIASRGGDPAAGAPGLWAVLPVLLVVVWLGGAAAWFVLAARRIACFHRLLRCATPAPAALQDEARALASRMGLRRCPAVWLLPGSLPPLVWAVGGRARLFFPRDLLRHLGPESRAALLVHELAHLRRRDHWVRALEWLAAGLYWWYPLVWYGCRRLHAAEEECCDAWVVSELPGAGTAYAGALLETVDFLAEAQAVAVLPPAASGFGRTYFLKRRLTLVIGGGPPRSLSLSGRVLLLGLALILLPFGLTRAPGSTAVPAEASEKPAGTAALPADDEPLTYGAPAVLLRGGDGQVEGAVPLADRTQRETLFPLLCLACSPDGKTLAAGSEEKIVCLLNAATGRLLRRLEGHEDAVSGVDFKFIIRAIARSKTYQLQSAGSGSDPRLYARMAVKGLTPLQLYDNFVQAAGWDTHQQNFEQVRKPRRRPRSRTSCTTAAGSGRSAWAARRSDRLPPPASRPPQPPCGSARWTATATSRRASSWGRRRTSRASTSTRTASSAPTRPARRRSG